MSGFFNKLFKFSAGAAGIGLGGAEVLLYLMSHRNGNVDFLFKGELEDEHNLAIKKRRDADQKWLEAQPLEHFYITSDDGLKLHASLLKSKIPSDKYVLAVHGYRATGIKEFDSISRFYHDRNINVFMIDHRASGLSGGTYITYGAKETEDCLKWLDFMNSTFGEDIKISLHGCSMGSATVMMMCGHPLPSNVVFAVCDCGYSSLKEQLYHNFAQYKLPPALCYTLYRQACIHQAGFDPEKVSPEAAMTRCDIPVIFAHGENDNFVPFKMVYKVYDACASTHKRLITVPGAEHVQAFQDSEDFHNLIEDYIDDFF